MIFPTVSGMLDAMKSIPVVGNGLDMSHSHWGMEALLMPRVMGEWEGDGGDEMSPRCPPRPDHQHAPGEGHMCDWRHC